MKLSKREKDIGVAKQILDAIGQQNEHEGAKWVKYFGAIARKKELEENQLKKDKLTKSRRNKEQYYLMLTTMLNDMVPLLDRPGKGYVVSAKKTGKGIEVSLFTRWGKFYKKAFTPSGIPEYDLTAVMTMVNAVEDTMWHLEETKRTDSGIYLT
jgi:hypothetical protein